MRKTLLLILGFVLLSSVSLFESCSPDSTNNPPTLDFTSPTQSSQQVGKGEAVPFVFVAKYNLNSKSSLVRVTIVAKYSAGGSDQVLDSLVTSANENQISITKNYIVPTTTAYGTVITATVKVTDKAGQSTEKSFTLNVANLTDITEYLSVTLGAQANATLGSAFASDSGVVYKVADAKKWQNRIDFIYFFDNVSGNAHTIAAPNDGILASVAPGLISGWLVKNATKFKEITMTASEFDAITTSGPITQKFDTSPGSPLSLATTLDDGSKLQQTYIVFRTAKSKDGIIQITSITETTLQSSMSIKVKIER